MQDAGGADLSRRRPLPLSQNLRSKNLPSQNFLAAILAAVVSSLTLFVGLGAVDKPIWDESYYVASTERYLEGRAQFASHPPLGLMLIAAGAALASDNRGLDTHALARTKAVAGEDVPAGYSFIGLRLASATFAVIGAVMFFQLMLAITGRTLAALLLANLYIFENAFLVQFRAGHLDAFQMVFVLAALLAFVRAARRGETDWRSAFVLGLACGLAAMVRLNGVFLALLGGLLVARDLWRAPRAWLGIAGRAGLMAAGVLLAVAATMTVHVAVSRHAPDLSTPAGQRDDGFVSPVHRDYLEGRRSLSPAVVLAASNDYRAYVAADFDGMARSDANGSSPVVWPLLGGSINYRWDSDGVTTRYLQMAGNAVGWGVSLAGLVVTAGLLAAGGWTDPRRRDLAWMLLLTWTGFMVLHAMLGLHRVMYVYHYFPALLIGFLLAAVALTEARERWPARIWRRGLATVMALHLACFAFQAPLTYHRPLNHGACEARSLGQTLVRCR